MTKTKELIDLIVNFDPESIPAEVIEHTKLFVLDTIGCAIGGYATVPGKQIISQAKQFQGAGASTLIGDGERVSTPFACWANTSLANVLDMDDVYAGTAHQANCLIPTAFGIGETLNTSGLDVLRAIVIGFEVGSRIMMYSWPSPDKGRTYFPSTWQVFDAVTAAAVLLDLDAATLYRAFGLAGTVAPLPLDMQKFVERPIGFAKNVFGWTTFTGLFWTMMAQEGAEGVAHVFDGDAGFWTIMGSDQHDFQKLTKDWGEKYNILETKYKPYPLCTWGHTSVDCFRLILREQKIAPSEIESIQVRTIQRAVDFLSSPRMETLYDSQFSLPHALSMVALGKQPGPAWMSSENMFENPEARNIAERVTMETDPAADKTFNDEKGLAIPTEVTVELKGGRAFKKALKYSKGTPNNPFSKEELETKFRSLAASVFGRERTEQIQECVMSMDTLKDISSLLALLGK